MSDDITPEDIAEFEALKAELLAEPGVDDGLREQLYDLSVQVLQQVILACKRIQELDDPMVALRIMAEVSIWAVELKNRLSKEVVTLRRPHHTTGMFKK